MVANTSFTPKSSTSFFALSLKSWPSKINSSYNHKDAKKGKLEIEYYSQDELDRIIDMIRTIQK